MGNFFSTKKSLTSPCSPSILPFPKSNILANSQENEFYKFDDVVEDCCGNKDCCDTKQDSKCCDEQECSGNVSNNDVLSDEDIILTLPKPPICEPEPMIELHNSFENVDDFLPEPQPIIEETPIEETPVEETPLEETPVEETPVEQETAIVTENIPEPQPEPNDEQHDENDYHHYNLPEPQPIIDDDSNDNSDSSSTSSSGI